MNNMSYCRFSNTLEGLEDCYDNIGNIGLSEDEEEARYLLISLCHKIALNCYDELEDYD